MRVCLHPHQPAACARHQTHHKQAARPLPPSPTHQRLPRESQVGAAPLLQVGMLLRQRAQHGLGVVQGLQWAGDERHEQSVHGRA